MLTAAAAAAAAAPSAQKTQTNFYLLGKELRGKMRLATPIKQPPYKNNATISSNKGSMVGSILLWEDECFKFGQLALPNTPAAKMSCCNNTARAMSGGSYLKKK